MVVGVRSGRGSEEKGFYRGILRGSFSVIGGCESKGGVYIS